jgi:hypothetical protein
MNENDYYLMMNPVMLTKQEAQELTVLLEAVRKEQS